MDDLFHNNLRLAREQAGLTQDQLAADIGVVRSTINQLECGKTRLFNKNLPKIAARLGRSSVGELLLGESPERLLQDVFTRTERENALRAEYENVISGLHDQIDAAKKRAEELQERVDELTKFNDFLMAQHRKNG